MGGGQIIVVGHPLKRILIEEIGARFTTKVYRFESHRIKVRRLCDEI